MKILKLALVVFAAMFTMCAKPTESPPLSDQEQLPEGKSIMLTSPKNMDVVYVGDTVNIKWIADSTVSSVCIEFSSDYSITFKNINDMGCVNFSDSNWANYRWIVPDSMGSAPYRKSIISDNCLLRILAYEDYTINDYSSLFAIRQRN